MLSLLVLLVSSSSSTLYRKVNSYIASNNAGWLMGYIKRREKKEKLVRLE